MIKNSEKKKIVFSGGGTLGHILPIIPLALKLYNDYDLYFIGTTRGMEEDYFQKNGYKKYFKETFFLDFKGIDRKNMFRNIKLIPKYFNVNKQIKNIYNSIKPNLVIGMGGYISGICINKALKMNIKTFIHEQNSVIGLANKLVYKKVDKVLLSYDIKNITSSNKYVIGNPRYSYVYNNYISKDHNTILIISGSIGSKYINDLIINNNDYFNYEDYIIKIVTGKKYYNQNKKIINKITNNKIKVYEFMNNLVEEMSKSSLIISRSGATTISEIMALRKPSILIPSPNVTNNHQYFNALYYKEKKCCEMIEEKDLTKESLDKIIRQIITCYGYKTKIKTNIDSIFTNDPLDEFIKLIEEI